MRDPNLGRVPDAVPVVWTDHGALDPQVPRAPDFTKRAIEAV
jgi:hypothetical protein